MESMPGAEVEAKMSFEVSKEFKDQLRIQEFAKKWGLKFEFLLIDFPAPKIKYYLTTIVAEFESLEDCEKWLIEEFEEK